MTYDPELPTPVSYVLRPGEGPKYLSFNKLWREIASAEQTGGEFALVEMSGVGGQGAPPHSHPLDTEAFYILEGTIRVQVDDLDHYATAGDFIYIPKGSRHKFWIESAFGRLLCFIAPGGFEDFFRVLGRQTDQVYPPNHDQFETPPSIDDILAVADRFNWKLEPDW